MSLEVECKVCGEEYDMRHGTCPACAWRVKRIAELEIEVKKLKKELRDERTGRLVEWLADDKIDKEQFDASIAELNELETERK